MTTHVSERQVRHWLDDGVVQDVTAHSSEGTAFNLELQLSRLPIHVIKEETWGPLRIVGRNDFDSERAKRLLENEDSRGEFLEYVGPLLAATPGFYTFLDEDGASCELRNADSMQVEYRIYPDEASQQVLMDAVMAIGTSMRYVRNVIVATHSSE